MEFKKKYSGEFLSRTNVRWRIDILQKSDTDFVVKDLSFPYDTPLSIEWSESDKSETVQGSAATLMVVSETDREFVDMYTTEAGSIRLDAYREDHLFWSGTLDTEVYEEPFAYEKQYEVTLTFSDVAILDRLMFAERATQFLKIDTLLQRAIEKTGINTSGIEYRVSTTTQSGGPIQNCQLLCENFYDEDGEAMTMRDAVEALLQPFALRMLQRDGKIYVYDINSIVQTAETAVYWDSDDSVLGFDKTYNNVEVTFSPYERNKLMECEVTKVMNGTTSTVTNDTSEGSINGFSVKISDSGKGELMPVVSGLDNFVPKYYEITPMFSGDDEKGVALFIVPHVGGTILNNPLNGLKAMCKNKTDRYIYSNATFYNTNVDMRYCLNIEVKLTVDARHNPFEDAGKHNDEGNYDRLKNNCNYSYIPFRLRLCDMNGNVIYHYDNSKLKQDGGFIPERMFMPMFADWKTGDYSGEWSYLAYYQTSEDGRKKETGLGHAVSNKQCIPYWRSSLPNIYTKLYTSGEYISLPPTYGYLSFEIGANVFTYDYKSDSEWQNTFDKSLLRWFTVESVNVKLMDYYGKDIDETDIKLSSWIDKNALETLSIDTTVGTLPEAHPTSRAQIYEGNAVVSKFKRAGVTDRLERLLCGTMYSQYSGRKKKLSGTTRTESGFCIYTDSSEPAKYMMISEVMDALKDESSIKIVEIAPDDFTGIEITEEESE